MKVPPTTPKEVGIGWWGFTWDTGSQQGITNQTAGATCPDQMWGQEGGYARGASLKIAEFRVFPERKIPP